MERRRWPRPPRAPGVCKSTIVEDVRRPSHALPSLGRLRWFGSLAQREALRRERRQEQTGGDIVFVRRDGTFEVTVDHRNEETIGTVNVTHSWHTSESTRFGKFTTRTQELPSRNTKSLAQEQQKKTTSHTHFPRQKEGCERKRKEEEGVCLGAKG